MLWAICFNCKNSQPEKPTIIKTVPKPTAIKPVKSKPAISSDTELKTGLPLYTRSHLNNKLHYDYKSISKQANCIEFNGKYILHSDIINWFKNYIS